jgi:exopolyphosphatase/guanosine-5'-triphosphate,3'-diphosphate pyrophosphatase
VRAELGRVLRPFGAQGPADASVATSKTFKQLARLAGAAPQREGPFVRRTLAAADVARLIPRLARLSSAQRVKLRGVSRPRSGQILAGAVVAKAAMSALNVRLLDVCPWSLREGVILRHLEIQSGRAVDLPLHVVYQCEADQRARLRALGGTA